MLVVAIVQLLKLMARPEGFEPPTPRSVEVLGAESRGSANRRYLLFLTFGHFCFMLIPTLLAQSGHKLVTSFLQREGFTSRLVILRLCTSIQETITCKAPRPACDRSDKRHIT